MKKFISQNKDNRNKMKNLTENSTILQRISQKAMLTLTTNTIPLLRDKINHVKAKASHLPKKALALALSPLFAITFSACKQADIKTPDNVETSYSSMNENSSLEDFETILKEYEQAVKYNDEMRQAELDDKVKQENYYKTIYEEIQGSIIKNLGYDPEKVEIVMGRDGFYLADKEKLTEGAYITPNGTVSNRVKIIDEGGKPVSIPPEMKQILDKGSIYFSSSTPMGIKATSDLYGFLSDINGGEKPTGNIATTNPPTRDEDR